MNSRRTMRTSAAGAVLAVGFVPALLITGTAGADTQVPLPDAAGQFSGADGMVAHVQRSGEQATVSGSMAANPLSRNATVSATAKVTVNAPGNVKVTGGRIETGYLVGCQVDLGSKIKAQGSGDAAGQKQPGNSAGNGAQGGGAGQSGGGNSDGGAGGEGGAEGGGGASSRGSGGGGGDSGGGGLSVSPGAAGAGLDSSGITPYVDPGVHLQIKPGTVITNPVQTFAFTGNSGVAQYVNHTISVEGCGGYAEARSYTTVTVNDNVMDVTQTLWGKPFSLG